MSGLYQEIAALGIERIELGANFGTAKVGGDRIPYEPKELGGIITTLRSYNPVRYLAIEGVSEGGSKYIAQAVPIPQVNSIGPREPLADIKKALRADAEPYDVISIDSRDMPLPASEIWKYMIGGKEPSKGFAKGAPIDYGPCKLKPGSKVIFNFADPACKDLYFQVRSMDNKLHQSKWAGMIKWA